MSKKSGETTERNAGGKTPLLNASRRLDWDAAVNEEHGKIPGITREYSGWDVYNNEAKKVDMELVKDWTTSLNFLLLFAAIFAAVLTAFVVESKKLLEPDPTKLMLDVMIFYTNSVANGTHKSYNTPDFEAPSFAITVNCLFFASLSVSLVAALASVIALQWVAEYDAAITRGGSSSQDRAKRRQFRHAGIVRWRMGEIIAALPILLYFSVVLFFSGLIVWIYAIHPTVGLVVAGGAGIAISFYGASTFLAVVCVSAPFRTPLSHWIYLLSRAPFSAMYHLVDSLHVRNIPAWLQEQHLLYAVSNRRTDQAVQDQTNLERDALSWLANQLSVSQNAYRRLLLVVDELASLTVTGTTSPILSEASWYSVFDLLGWRYLTSQAEALSGEDREAMAILQRCYSIPAIRQVVIPAENTHRVARSNEITYWSQYCEVATSAHWQPDATIPNCLHLLLRDLPRSLDSSPEEIDALLLLSRWRNSHSKSSQVWKQVFDPTGSLSSTFFNSCVITFTSYVRHHACFAWNHPEDQLLFSIIHDITQLATSRQDITADTTVALVRAYEALLVGHDFYGKPTDACLTRPLRYGRAIQQIPNIVYGLHEAIILLLARQVHRPTPAERSVRVKEIILMLWLRPLNPVLRNWDYIIERYESPEHMDTETVTDWIKEAHQVPHIVEIIHHLVTVQVRDPSIGPLWRATADSNANDPHFVEVLQTLDHLMQRDCTTEDHCTMVAFLCQDLELEPGPDFNSYFNTARLRALGQLRDPCLQIIASCTQGLDFIRPVSVPEEYRERRTASLDRVALYIYRRFRATNSARMLHLHASLWPMFSNQKRIYLHSFTRPDVLSQVQRIFRYPVPCSHCLDGSGHLAFHLLDAITTCGFPLELTLFGAVPLEGRWMAPALIILCLWYAEKRVSLKKLFNEADERCLVRLQRELDDISLSQAQILALVWNASNDLEPAVFPESVAAIIAGIHVALRQPYEVQTTPLLAPLSQRIIGLRNILLTQGVRSFVERKAVSNEAVKVSYRLIDLLATRTISGTRASGMVSCARAKGYECPAVGWLPSYVE